MNTCCLSVFYLCACPHVCAAEPSLRDHEDQFGRTPLMYCVLADRLDCAEILLKAGASVNKADHSQRTALHLAAQKVLTSAGRHTSWRVDCHVFAFLCNNVKKFHWQKLMHVNVKTVFDFIQVKWHRSVQSISSSGKPVPPSGISYGLRAYGRTYQLLYNYYKLALKLSVSFTHDLIHNKLFFKEYVVFYSISNKEEQEHNVISLGRRNINVTTSTGM